MPDPTVTTDKKPRRRKAKRPAADPATPRKPRTTLLSRIEAMGPTHLSAYRTLAQGNPTWAAAVSSALDSRRRIDAASMSVMSAKSALQRAEERLSLALKSSDAGKAVLSKLDRVARTIAEERGDVPATDDAHAAPVAPEPDAD